MVMIFENLLTIIIVIKLFRLELVENTELVNASVESEKSGRKVEQHYLEHLAKNPKFNTHRAEHELEKDVKLCDRVKQNDSIYDVALVIRKYDKKRHVNRKKVKVTENDKVNVRKKGNRKKIIDNKSQGAQKHALYNVDGEMLKPFDAIAKLRNENELRRSNFIDEPMDYKHLLNNLNVRKKKSIIYDMPDLIIYEGELPSPQFIKALARMNISSGKNIYLQKEDEEPCVELKKEVKAKPCVQSEKENEEGTCVKLSKQIETIPCAQTQKQFEGKATAQIQKQVVGGPTFRLLKGDGPNVFCDPSKQSLSMETGIAPKFVEHIDRTIVEEIIQVDIPLTEKSKSTKTLCTTTPVCIPQCVTTASQCPDVKTYHKRTKIPYLFLKKY